MVVDPVLQHIVASGLAILFFSAGGQKLIHQEEFKAALRAYELTLTNTNTFLVRAVPVAELLAGVLLLFFQTQSVAIVLSSCLLASYALAMGINLWRGRSAIDCGCQLGGGRQPISWSLVWRNLLLILAALTLLLPAIERSLHWLDYVVVTFGVVIACLLYGISNNLIDTHSRGVSL